MNEKTNWKVITLVVSVLIIAIVSVVCAVVMQNKDDTPATSTSASSEDSSSSVQGNSGVNSSSSSEEKKLIYADSEGNTYEFIKIVDSKDGRQLVIFQNTETGTVSMALKSYFDEHYHIVNG